MVFKYKLKTPKQINNALFILNKDFLLLYLRVLKKGHLEVKYIFLVTLQLFILFNEIFWLNVMIPERINVNDEKRVND